MGQKRGDTGAPREYGLSEQLVWFERFGYVRVRDVVRWGVLSYVFLTGIVTVLTSDLITLLFLGLLAVLGLGLAPFEEHFSPNRRVAVYAEDGLYIAEHVGSGKTRHGQTREEALANLDGVI